VPYRTLLETEGKVKLYQTQVGNLRQKLRMLGLAPAQIEEVLETRRVVDALPVRAPIDGRIARFDRVRGEVIRADEPLFEIHDLSQVQLQAFVGERELAHVQVGQAARIGLVAYPAIEAAGVVAQLGPVVGADSRTAEAWIEFEDPPPVELLHNMLARVTLTIDRPAPTPAVPVSAVMRDGLRSFVFLQKPDGAFERRPIELGRSDDRFVEIAGGLKQGDRVATRGVQQLQTAYAAVR
jgi:RND family efflux transporter MFP subunit